MQLGFVYFNFTGSEAEIKPDGREAAEVKWVQQDQLTETIHEERRDKARIAVEDLQNPKNLQRSN